MQKRRKCQSCGGAYTFRIANSAFERENRFFLSCPYCNHVHYLVIEEGRLIDEDKASKFLKSLPATKIPTHAWLELLTKEEKGNI